MKTIMRNHTFVVLAYEESEYLEECVRSVLGQTVKSGVVIATSTRNSFIEGIAHKYNLEIIENSNTKKGIADDFDFALSCVSSKFVTIAHQDDIYNEKYLENVSKVLDDKTLIVFTDYAELKKNGIEKSNINLSIKSLLLFPLRFKALQDIRIMKRTCLSFGNPICCPSVTFNKSLMREQLFVSSFRSNMDWYAWEKLSRVEGKFVYVSSPLMVHRIHEKSTTSEMINDDRRTSEDLAMFEKFWPPPIAKIIARIYKKSEKSNG